MQSNKNLILRDENTINEHHSFSMDGIKGNRVILTDPITGKVLFDGMNKVVISGSQRTLADHFGINPFVELPTYNNALGLDGAKARTDFEDLPLDPITNKVQREKIVLFCCGTGGCGSENSQVYDVKYTDRIKPENLIPFRYQLIADNDLTDELKNVYFGKKTLTNYYAYYFKAFESNPVPYMRYTDGTDVEAGLYDSSITLDAETYMELSLQITKEDFRDYFVATSANGINDALINQISLCSAWRESYEENGNSYIRYQDITPMTLLNIPNESLIDTTKGINITYQVFY